MSVTSIDLFQDGLWIKAPAIDVNGNTVVVTGKWLRTAAVEAEECLEHEVSDPEAFIRRLKEYPRELGADIFTFAQKLPSTNPLYSFPLEWDSVAAMRLTSFSAWWDGLPQEARKNARRAAKRGVVLRRQEVDDELVRGIVAINNETPTRQGRRFTHFGEDFDKVKRDFLSFSSRSDLLCAYSGDELIGLVKIIYCGPIAAIMKLQSKISHYDKRPSNALMAMAIEMCADRGSSFVTYGQYRYGNQKHTSLMEFKDRLGFGEFLVPRYYVPLTNKGRLGTRLKVHRGVVGVLPASFISVGRAVRSKWFKPRIAGVAQR